MDSNMEQVDEERKRMSVFYGPPLPLKSKIWRAIFSRPVFSMFTLISTAIMLTHVYFRAEDVFLHNLDSACNIVNDNFNLIMNSREEMNRIIAESELQVLKLANDDFIRTVELVMSLSKHYAISHIEHYYKTPVCMAKSLGKVLDTNIGTTVGDIVSGVSSVASRIGSDISGIFGMYTANKGHDINKSVNIRSTEAPPQTSTIQSNNLSDKDTENDVISEVIDDKMDGIINVFIEDIKKGQRQIDAKIIDSIQEYNSSDSTGKKHEYVVCDMKLSEASIEKIKSYTRPTVYIGVCMIPICGITIVVVDICNSALKRRKDEKKVKLFRKAIEVATGKLTRTSFAEKRALTANDARDLMAYARNPKIWIYTNLFWKRLSRYITDPYRREQVRWAIICGVHIPGLVCSIVGLVGVAGAKIQIYMIDHSAENLYAISEYMWNSTNSVIMDKIAAIMDDVGVSTPQILIDVEKKLGEIKNEANIIYKNVFLEHKKSLTNIYEFAEYNINAILSEIPFSTAFLRDQIYSYTKCIFSSKIKALEQIQKQIDGGIHYTLPVEPTQHYNHNEVDKVKSTMMKQIKNNFNNLLLNNKSTNTLPDGMSPITQGLITFLEYYKQSLRNSIIMNSLLILFGLSVPIITILCLIVSILKHKKYHTKPREDYSYIKKLKVTHMHEFQKPTFVKGSHNLGNEETCVYSENATASQLAPVSTYDDTVSFP